LLYYPSYIEDGVAIHGNPLVPVVPASHGCIRIPMFAAKDFYNMASVGTIVLVYGDNGTAASDRSLGKPADPFAVLPPTKQAH
ncbi:MAG: L,D-transpeptidase, partial [Blastocatellia bacterium]